ncbi:MAG TPA: DUF3429 domain-containing protein [Methylibium sp.]|nr:DUF3429 domain-containing protein [Methylibium sp.]
MSPDPTLAPLVQSGPTALASRLGQAGLLPFVAGALAAWAAPEGLRAGAGFALQAYAALIISFLGGMHWGLAVRTAGGLPASLWWGIAVSLAAWLALLAPRSVGLLLCGALLLASYAVDRRLYPPVGAAGWLRLRLHLSSVASLCCFLAAPAA